MSKIVNRLYRSFKPETYDLSIKLADELNSFEGKVVISGKRVGKPSKRFTLHQNSLKIKDATITHYVKGEAVQLKIIRINKQDKLDELRLHVDSPIYPGDYKIEISFEAKITKKMSGIYPSTFTAGSKKQKIIATQFESHHARQAFPCVDEPEAKSVFNLTLDTPVFNTVLSNTQVLSQKKTKTHLKTIFEPTPKMSTYLLAFIVGDMKFLESKTRSGVIVRTYATADKVSHTKFALETAVKTLDFYDEYFDIPYPLKKCDFIALPDFASGAMENWGCITFREQALLVDDNQTSLTLKQYVANVVAHELTHQWFGNLVTMRWWTDLWLNESFASWMSYLAVDHLFPDWKVWTQFIVDEQGIGLKLDALEFTHPIEVSVHHPDEIRTIFDEISYEKGASVIAMLEDYLGPNEFKNGIKHYLKTHAYSNTDTIDLWKALEHSSKKNVSKFMNSWTTQSGYPIVSVNVTNSAMKLHQQRFYLNPLAKKTQSTWTIPLLAENKSLKQADFSTENEILKLSDSSDNHFLLNSGRKGFYRVTYDSQTLDDIVNENLEKLPELDRLGLLSDCVEAAKAGFQSSLEVLELLESYSRETSVVVWEIIASFLGSMKLVMNDDRLREALKPYIRKFASGELKRLGLKSKTSDSHFDKLLRPLIIGMSASADEPSVLEFIRKLFDRCETDSSLIDPDLRAVVYVTSAKHGGAKEFDKLLNLYRGTSSSEEKINLCNALTAFKQPELIERALKLIKSDDVRLQDVAYWISYIFTNHDARVQAWDWIKANWDWLDEDMGEDLSFYRLPISIGRCYSDASFIQEFSDFFKPRLGASLSRPFNQAIETIQWQSEWKERDLSSILDYFASL